MYWNRDAIETALESLLDAKAKSVAANIDAGACGTKRDFERAREAREELENATNEFWKVLDALRGK